MGKRKTKQQKRNAHRSRAVHSEPRQIAKNEQETKLVQRSETGHGAPPATSAAESQAIDGSGQRRATAQERPLQSASSTRWWRAPLRWLRASQEEVGDNGRTRLTAEQLLQRIDVSAPDLVADVYALAQRKLDIEERRDGAITAKAAGLVGAAGLALTLLFTFGGLLIEKHEKLAILGDWWVFGANTLYVAALLLGLGSALVALLALFVRGDYSGIDERDIFHDVVLREAVESKPGESDDFTASQAAAMRYRKHVAVHLWLVAQNNFRVQESKAKSVAFAQLLYVLFLVAILLIGLAMALAAYKTALVSRSAVPGVPKQMAPMVTNTALQVPEPASTAAASADALEPRTRLQVVPTPSAPTVQGTDGGPLRSP